MHLQRTPTQTQTLITSEIQSSVAMRTMEEAAARPTEVTTVGTITRAFKPASDHVPQEPADLGDSVLSSQSWIFTRPGVASSRATKATLTRNEMVGWAMDRVEEKWRCRFIAAKPMPATKDTSKAVGASQGQGTLGCGMVDMVDVDVDVGIIFSWWWRMG